MKPKLIHNWPAVKNEHDDVSTIIRDVIKDFKQDKKDGKYPNYKNQFENDYIHPKTGGINNNDDEDYRRMSRDELMYEENTIPSSENYERTPKTKTNRRMHTTE